MSRKKLTFLCIFIVGALLFFLYLVEKDNQILNKTLVNSDTVPVVSDHIYYAKMENNQIIVYNKDHSVYEYTDLEPEFLPVVVREQLGQGIYFMSQEELYEFLETYTS